MKPQIRFTVFACVLLSLLTVRPAYAQGARLRLDRLTRLADKAKEVVDVNLDESMLQQASAMGGKQPDEKTRQVLQGLKGVYVKSFEFGAPGGYSDADVEAIRSQLQAPGWSRIISVREKGELTEIYTWSDGKTSGGLAIIAAEAQELTVVNLIGQINIAQLGAIQSQFGLSGVLGAK